ncbi:MAG: hypothetical protein MUF51_07545 [Vicinamibacteria bacterium]|nr:hypothetical protein [Vicinamibacteria bacterium]
MKMDMTTKTTLVTLSVILLAATFCFSAEQRGIEVAAGGVWLTKAGEFTWGPGAIESDHGYAVRGRARYSFGMASVGLEAQSASQEYGANVKGVAPWTLSSTYVGVVGAVHPIGLLGICPYAELGVGTLHFSDDVLNPESGPVFALGVGTKIGLAPRLSLDLGVRLMRKTLRYPNLVQDIQYQPKLVSLMVSLAL